MINDVYVLLLASILAYMLALCLDISLRVQKRVSLLAACYGLWLYSQLPAVGYTVLVLVFSLFLLWGATIDKQFYILPDEGAWLLVIGGLVHIYIRHQSLGLALLVSGGLALISLSISYISRQGLGLGDVKWMSALALWFTPQGVYEMISLSCILGSLYLLIHILKEKAVCFISFLMKPSKSGGGKKVDYNRQESYRTDTDKDSMARSYVPFGPYLAMGACLAYIDTYFIG